ncbi:Type I restriction-modification system specificity subunit (plasmid) [Roseomonas mucosa]|uniref:Type I restriction-modification system specificity subunit n=1 Tax=Roseomonas mucosa TaxID=207340 RepID=A0A4Y1MRE2_9PROT|nr:restriction endonuclease subunit S [Roseomonas mucosa]AWV20250.1 Type I restriction-modification system specificity subunit [Roseomonas mucosa]QDD97223.1 Type I restriction-modification system specificity subunit [Roseomonas mucosa]
MSVRQYPSYKDSGIPWLGDVPADWPIVRLKKIFSERDERSLKGEEVLLSVSAYTGVRPRSEIVDADDYLTRADSLAGYKIVNKDDLVVNIMLAWNRGLGVSEHEGIVSPAYCVFSPNTALDPTFANYVLRSNEYIAYYKAHSTGVIDSRLRIYPDKFLGLTCALPPRPEQLAIAAFLDRETGKIDALVAEQEWLIALLKEKRQAIISQAVTKGLDPNVPMKDSGVEWLGEVPAHWQVVPLMRLTQPDRPIMYGIVLPGPDVGEGVPILKGGNVKPSRMNLESMARTTPEIEAPFARARLRQGDLAYSIRGTISDCEIVPVELNNANITQDVARIAPRHDVDPRWLRFALLSEPVKESLACGSLGAAVRGINIFDLKRARIPTPPEAEREKIAEHLTYVISEFEHLSLEAERAITLLRERRSALISAAVTGKIDVRDHAATERAAAA